MESETNGYDDVWLRSDRDDGAAKHGIQVRSFRMWRAGRTGFGRFEERRSVEVLHDPGIVDIRTAQGNVGMGGDGMQECPGENRQRDIEVCVMVMARQPHMADLPVVAVITIHTVCGPRRLDDDMPVFSEAENEISRHDDTAAHEHDQQDICQK